MLNINKILLTFVVSVGIFIFKTFIALNENVKLFYSYYMNDLGNIEDTYDYIIVGSGTAGTIVTLRLAENANHSVLLLEAGPYDHSFFNIPVAQAFLLKSSIDWQYYTEPQQHACKGLINNRSNWPMGRIFGGTTLLNNMIYTRGHRDDFSDWFGDISDYNYERDILPYFQKSEYHISPLVLNNLTFTTRLSEAILGAADILGYQTSGFTGFTHPRVNIKNGKRSKPSDIFNQRYFHNVDILTNAQVTKVLFKSNYEAYAVKYKYFNTYKIVKARKAVILSAGTIGTPKILLLSGIGPEEHLQKTGIKTRKKLPVGDNLQDHITTGLDLVILNTTLSLNINAILSPKTIYDYFFNGKGPWTFPGCEVVGFLSKNRNEVPKIQFMVLPLGLVLDRGLHLKNTVGIKPSTWKYFQKILTNQTVSILPILLHPKSRGTVRLKDSDPDSPPVINPNYLSASEDVDSLIRGIGHIKQFVSTEPMQKLGAKINPDKFPGCESHSFDTEPYWECYVRQLTLTSFHPVGTCRIGRVDDPTSVVDHGFKVIGTNKLFIADASIIPSLTSANINAAVAMIAEKAADKIKEYEHYNRGFCSLLDAFVSKC